MNIEQLEKLNELREKGIITQEQFEIEKKKILQSDSDVKSCNNLSKPRKINWKHLGISFFIAVTYFLLICFLSAFFQHYTESKDSILPPLVYISAVIFTLYAIKIETYKYKYCSSAWAIFFYIIFCIPLAIWIVSYQFLQINTGCASLIESKDLKKRNKILTNIGIALLLITTIGVLFILYTQATYDNISHSNETASILQYIKKENPKALQNNSTSSVVLPSEYNQRLFRNIESKEFQMLLQQGIEQYLINYLEETGNQPYSGKLDDYLQIFTPYIPLPKNPVILNNISIEFTYGKYEIAAGYIGPISFSITKEKLDPFLIKK